MTPRRSRPKAILLQVTQHELDTFALQAMRCDISRQQWMRETLLWACGKRRKRPIP